MYASVRYRVYTSVVGGAVLGDADSEAVLPHVAVLPLLWLCNHQMTWLCLAT